MKYRPVMLCIMDGFGLAPAGPGNAIAAARTPNLDAIWKAHPHAQLQASGRAVGLPDGQMGNSEVGHTNMGAGRVVWQDLAKITADIESGVFFENKAFAAAIDHVKSRGTALHLFGLMSDGGVHSHIEHIKALARLAAARGVQTLWVHCFLDGRDTPPTSGAGYVEDMERALQAEEKTLRDSGLDASYRIGSVCGRYYAMDRDKRWERVKEAYEALTEPVLPGSIGGSDAVKAAYAMDETDEFVRARVCNGFDAIEDGAAVIFANFRPDRAREITRAFVDPDFDGFERQRVVKDLCYVCMTTYDAAIPNVLVAYPPKQLKNTLGEYVSGLGLTQLRIAETEKYAHVTFFFNGGVEEPYPGEERILIPSPKVATYDLQPSMSAPEVTDAVCAQLSAADCPDFIILNFANCDMVGHTGVFDAAVKAVETVDACVGRVCEAMRKAGGRLFITADHGNADEMLDEAGNVVTAHSTNPVPFIFCDFAKDAASCGAADAPAGRGLHKTAADSDPQPCFTGLSDGALCDIAPTMLEAASLLQPLEMEGKSLLR
ncbi:MAG: 2,3-bisphosphoglycerate-independent phosphoglycerate mutase [Clostridia bacterium]|nr:2,3-bisphosphoglycerate-independent phosphoglycerate mutase [Clostridia bacterium]